MISLSRMTSPPKLPSATTISQFGYPISNFCSDLTTNGCTRGGGVVELRCGLLCLYTYNACRGGDLRNKMLRRRLLPGTLQQLRLQLQQKIKQAESGQPVSVSPVADEPAKQAKN